MAPITRTELYIVNLATLVLAVAISQFSGPQYSQPAEPTGATAAWHWGQPPGQPAQWIWGVKDPSGMIHVSPFSQSQPETSVGFVDQSGAINYGLNMGDIAKDAKYGDTAVIASSAKVEADAFSVAAKPCPDEGCPNPLENRDFFGIKHEVRLAVLIVCTVFVIGVAVIVVARGKK